MTVARVALPAATGQAFDYWIPDGIGVARGSIVRVRLANRRHVGVVVEIAATSDVERERVQPIDDVVALPPLPEDVVALAEFVAAYYREPLGLALALAVPPVVGGARRRAAAPPASLVLTDAGREALASRVARAPAAAALLSRISAGPLDREALAALGDADRRRLVTWRAEGWVEEPAPGRRRSLKFQESEHKSRFQAALDRMQERYRDPFRRPASGLRDCFPAQTRRPPIECDSGSDFRA